MRDNTSYSLSGFKLDQDIKISTLENSRVKNVALSITPHCTTVSFNYLLKDNESLPKVIKDIQDTNYYVFDYLGNNQNINIVSRSSYDYLELNVVDIEQISLMCSEHDNDYNHSLHIIISCKTI